MARLIGLVLVAGVCIPGMATADSAAKFQISGHDGVMMADIKQADWIEFNGVRLGVIARFEKGGHPVVGILPSGGKLRVLGRAQQFDVRGVFDLAKGGVVPRRLVLPSRLRLDAAKQPVLVLRTRYTQAATKKAAMRRKVRSNRSRPEVTEMTWFISLSGRLDRVLRLKTKYQSSDGYGGHDISGLKVTFTAEGQFLTGQRQDRLPARRARCMKPAPVPIRYKLESGRFREVDRHPKGGCGSGGSMKLPKFRK